MRAARLFALMMGLCLTGCLDAAPDRELTGRDGEVARHGFNDALKSARVTRIDVGALTDGLAEGSRLPLTLPGAGQVELVVQTVQQLWPGVTTFTGQLADDERSDFTFSVERGRLVGAVHRATQAWLVEPYLGTDQYVIRTIDRGRLPQDEPIMSAQARVRVSTEPTSIDVPGFTTAVSNGEVRVLFLYATDVGNPNAQAANIVAAFNTSLSLSGISSNNYLTLAGVQPVASDFNDQTRNTIRNTMNARGAPFTNINALMSNAAADIAFLLVNEDPDMEEVTIGTTHYGRVGGVANIFDQNNPFALSTQSYALGDNTALHEIGHVFGGHHENDGTSIARPVVAADHTWMTIMGGYIECPFNGLTPTCVRLNRWSNPDQTYMGFPLGVAGQRDMRTHLQGSMPTVSNWGAEPNSPATMTSPPPGSTLPGSTVTFSWTTGSGVSQYYLYVGSSQGAYDIYLASQGLATSGTVSGVPTDGRTIWVRLWSLTSAGWQFNDYAYTAANQATPAVLYSPAPGSTLAGSSVTFYWTTGTGVSQYYLYIGNSPGAYDLYNASQGTATAGTVSGLPTDGRTLYVRLWSYTSAGWLFRDYTYVAATAATPAVLWSPTPGSTLPGANVTFYWTTGSGVSQYYLYIGSSYGGYDLYNASQGAATSGTVYGLPTDGRAIYVRLWSYTSAGWQYRDYQYTAATTCSSLNGTHGQLWTTVSVGALWAYHDGWCTVGRGLPQQCWDHTYYYYQDLQGSYCTSTGSSGSCYDGDAWWWVTCSALVDCIYNCSGQCVQASC